MSLVNRGFDAELRQTVRVNFRSYSEVLLEVAGRSGSDSEPDSASEGGRPGRPA